MESTTTLLATAVGFSLLTASAVAQNTGSLDRKMARELAVLSRVLKKSLGEMRRSTAATLSSVPVGPRPAVKD